MVETPVRGLRIWGGPAYARRRIRGHLGSIGGGRPIPNISACGLRTRKARLAYRLHRLRTVRATDMGTADSRSRSRESTPIEQ